MFAKQKVYQNVRTLSDSLASHPVMPLNMEWVLENMSLSNSPLREFSCRKRKAGEFEIKLLLQLSDVGSKQAILRFANHDGKLMLLEEKGSFTAYWTILANWYVNFCRGKPNP
jgi:hypothetical protein